MQTTSDLEQQELATEWAKMDDLLLITDRDGKLLYANQKAQQACNVKDSACVRIEDWLANPELFRETIEPSLKQSGTWCGMLQLCSPGSHLESPVCIAIESLYEQGNPYQPVGFIYILRKSLIDPQVFKGLHFTQASFTKFLTNNLAEGIYVLDSNGHVIFINPAAEAMLGWKSGELIGKSIHQAIHYQKADGSAYPESECSLISAVNAGQILTHHEDVFFRADGTPFSVLCTSAPLTNNEEIIGAVLSFHDISEQKKTELELTHSKTELQATNFLLNSVTSVQSHFIAGMDQWTLWEYFIQDILTLTNSEFGYIGEVYYKESEVPYLVFRGLTNIAWNPETQALFDGFKTQGLEFRNLETLYGIGLKNNGCTVISNNPAHDPRRGGLPPGHPPLHSFMGLPIYGNNGSLIGQIGLANRPGGYDKELEEYLAPLLVTCSYIIEAYRNIESRQRADKALEAQYDLTQTITDNATAALLMMDPEGFCTFLNPAAEKMFGYTFEEIRHQPMHHMIHHSCPDGSPYPLSECPIARALPNNSQVRAHEDVFFRKDGTSISVLCAAEPIIREGQPIATVIEVRDITEEKRVQQAIIESEKRFRRLADLAPIMIWVTDAEGQFDYVNKAVFQFTGWQPDQNLDLTWMDAIHPDDRAYVNQVFRTALQHKRDFEIEYRLLRADGEYRWLFFSGKPRLMENNQCIGMIGSSIDMTERRHAKEELERLVDARTVQLQAINQELEAFCYSVSHDLRTPLRGIDGFSQAILEDYSHQLDEQGLDYLHRVRQETQRMGQLIDDMLKLSRLTRWELREENVDLSMMAQDILKEFREQEPERIVTLEIQDGVTALGDARLLRVALQNLFSNAWKFTMQQSIAHIQFGTIEENNQTTYFIRDNGAGFDMAYVDKLFGAFQRLHQNHEFSGTGVGLAIVQRIILRHGGTIWAEGITNQGATFYFTLNEMKLQGS